MYPLRLVPCVLGLSACASLQITSRAATDLRCQEDSISLTGGAAGEVRATGCGDWIDYVCTQQDSETQVACTEERRGHVTSPAGRLLRTPAAGSEQGVCFGNQTCFPPLQCIQGLCMRPTGLGKLAGPCDEGDCESPLTCVREVCVPRGPPPLDPRVQVGQKSGVCYPNGTCDIGLRCADNLCLEAGP